MTGLSDTANHRGFVEGVVRSASDRYGFRAIRDRNFYTRGPQTSGIINIQKSDFGPSFYLNAGVWLNSLSDDVPTAHHKYHIRWRVDSIDDNGDLGDALDFDFAMPESSRRSAIFKGVEKNGFGLIAKLATEDAALRFVASTPQALVLREAREFAQRKLGHELL